MQTLIFLLMAAELKSCTAADDVSSIGGSIEWTAAATSTSDVFDFSATANSPVTNASLNVPIPCGRNERLAFCRKCEGACSDAQMVACNPGCSSLRCYCDPDKGFVRDRNGSCVPRSKCSEECGPNEVYTRCRTCEGICGEIGRTCPLICRESGCECPFSDGYVRDFWRNCIPKLQCPWHFQE
uniref:TIL domain-containing protein n=1 Tax=Ascaris lumbricoides TaxID=6252 RepID=A0A0M3IHQ7_ASCLU